MEHTKQGISCNEEEFSQKGFGGGVGGNLFAIFLQSLAFVSGVCAENVVW